MTRSCRCRRSMWEDDPIEFVRTIYDVMEDYTSQRVQCARLLVELCQVRRAAAAVVGLGFRVCRRGSRFRVCRRVQQARRRRLPANPNLLDL